MNIGTTHTNLCMPLISSRSRKTSFFSKFHSDSLLVLHFFIFFVLPSNLPAQLLDRKSVV